MNIEQIDPIRQHDMAQRLRCVFRENGEFAEMSRNLADYQEQTVSIPGVRFGFYKGDIEPLLRMVATVDGAWPVYFQADSPIFCAFCNEQPVSFCIVDEEVDCLISRPGIRVGSIGCVGTLPDWRGRGIGLRMVDLATLLLKEAGCNKAYISYTAIDFWYARLGYSTFARFDIP